MSEQKYPAYAENFEGKHTYEIEEKLLSELELTQGIDPRWKAIAKTHFEQGFMAFRRGFIKNQGINPMNKFSLKDVKWVYDVSGIKVTHMLTGIEKRQRQSNPDGSFTADIFEALKELEILVNAHYEKENMVEDEPKLTKDKDYLNRRDKIEIRAKALELACNLARTPRYDGDIPIVEVAQRFYNYIIKGE